MGMQVLRSSIGRVLPFGSPVAVWRLVRPLHDVMWDACWVVLMTSGSMPAGAVK